MPKKPRSIRGRMNWLKRFEKGRKQDVLPEPAVTVSEGDVQASISGEGMILCSTKEYGKEIRSKVEVRKCLLSSVAPPDSSPEETDPEKCCNIIISQSRMKNLTAALPVWCENCSTTSHNLEMETTAADVLVTVVCVKGAMQFYTVISQSPSIIIKKTPLLWSTAILHQDICTLGMPILL